MMSFCLTSFWHVTLMFKCQCKILQGGEEKVQLLLKSASRHFLLGHTKKCEETLKQGERGSYDNEIIVLAYLCHWWHSSYNKL